MVLRTEKHDVFTMDLDSSTWLNSSQQNVLFAAGNWIGENCFGEMSVGRLYTLAYTFPHPVNSIEIAADDIVFWK